jgi:hypothetical protein
MLACAWTAPASSRAAAVARESMTFDMWNSWWMGAAWMQRAWRKVYMRLPGRAVPQVIALRAACAPVAAGACCRPIREPAEGRGIDA